MDHQAVDPIAITKRWLSSFVIGWGMCPFAKRPWEDEMIGWWVIEGDDGKEILGGLHTAQQGMSSDEIVTALILLPDIDLAFEEMYAYVAHLQEYCDTMEWDMQLVAFHPEFSYSDTDYDDITNATNRSPYPMIHVLSDSQLQKIRESDYDVESLTEQNRQRLLRSSWQQIMGLYKDHD